MILNTRGHKCDRCSMVFVPMLSIYITPEQIVLCENCLKELLKPYFKKEKEETLK